MLDKLRQMEENYHAMQEKMMDPDVVGVPHFGGSAPF